MLKLNLKKGNPSGTARRGHANDSSGNSQPIKRWSETAWRSWRKKFVKVINKSANGKFWLVNNAKWGEFEDRGVKYYPNIWCRFRIDFVNTDADAHHSITVYRVTHAGRGFHSDYELMDTYDIKRQRKHKRAGKKWIRQRPAVHEFFHALGVRHVDHGKAHCPIGAGGFTGNESDCYGVAYDDRKSLMGSGMALLPKFADPWRRAAVKLTGEGAVGTADDWAPKTKRHYPRTLQQVNLKAAVKTRPRR